MTIKKLAKNYYVAEQGNLYGYGTTAFKAIRSCLRQLWADIAVFEESRRIFGSTTLPDSHINNFGPGQEFIDHI